MLWSVQFSRSIISESLQPHGLQHARPPCQSSTPGVYSNPMSIDSVMPSNHLILCHPLLPLPSIFPSIRVFTNKSVLHIRWPKYWSFSINPFNEYLGLISFRTDWLNLLGLAELFSCPITRWQAKFIFPPQPRGVITPAVPFFGNILPPLPALLTYCSP